MVYLQSKDWTTWGMSLVYETWLDFMYFADYCVLEKIVKSLGRRGCTTHSLLISRGCISWHIPRDGLIIREWPYTASNQDALGCTPPPTSRFPSALEMSLGTRDLSVVRDAQPNTSLLSAVYGYNTLPAPSRECTGKYCPRDSISWYTPIGTSSCGKHWQWIYGS